MEPLRLNSPLKDYIWGGTRLKTEFGKSTSLERVAESWELSCHKDGPSLIENGDFAGKTLPEYIKIQGKSVLGTNCEKFDYFPILIKLIDAQDNLSVQVHPDNNYALRVEGEYGKTEMWYIVDCAEGASLIYGFDHEISAEEFARRIQDNTLLNVCNIVPVKKGDVFFIEAGTLHAIGKGILIAEIQQNSNTTYRVYDYGRVGADGNPRQLHIEKAKEVTKRLPPTRDCRPLGPSEQRDGYIYTLLNQCEYFTVEHYEISQSASLNATPESFLAVLAIDGSGTLCYGGRSYPLQKGDSYFIPAGIGSYSLKGKIDCIISRV